MDNALLGIHHVTAIASDPQRNLDFYAGILGLRLVKKTVNFDDPGTYHFYYGDGVGTPGTILTFFPWPDARRGRYGNGQVTVTSFAVPREAIGWWVDRFQARGVTFEPPVQRFDEQALLFEDHDGLRMELVASEQDRTLREPWREGAIPPEYALRGFHGVSLSEQGYERTAGMLKEVLGFAPLASTGNRFRYQIGEGAGRAAIDLLCQPDTAPGRIAAGAVHHIAWRAADDAAQRTWRATLADLGHDVTPVLDRQYFHSIYFREPGGVLFEIATDPPGFEIDETPAELGTHLKLPPWLESRRAHIEQSLPPVHLPEDAR